MSELLVSGTFTIRNAFQRNLFHSAKHITCRYISPARKYSRIRDSKFLYQLTKPMCIKINSRNMSSVLDGDKVISNTKKSNQDVTFDSQIQSIAEDIGISEGALTSSDILYRLSEKEDISCSARITAAEKLIDTISQFPGKLTEEYCIGLLKCYIKSNSFNNVESFINKLQSCGIQPSPQVQILLLKCLSEIGKHDNVITIVEDLKKQGIECDEINGSLIYSIVKLRGIGAAWDELGASKIVPESNVYTSLLRGAILSNNEQELMEIVEKIKEGEIAFSKEQILSIIETAFSNEKCDLLKHVFQMWQSNLLCDAFKSMLIREIYSKDINSCFLLLKNIISKLNLASVDAVLLCTDLYKQFLQLLIDIQNPVFDTIQMSLKLRQIEGCEYAVEHVLYYYLKMKDTKSSLLVFQTMYENGIQLEPHYFWPLITFYSEIYGQEGVFYAAKKMLDFNIYYDVKTLKLFIYPKLPLDNIYSHIERLKGNRTVYFLQELFIEYALENGHFQECLNLLENMPLLRNINYSSLQEACEKAILDFPFDSSAKDLFKKLDFLDPVSLLKKLCHRGDENKIIEVLKFYKEGNMTIPKKDMEWLLNSKSLPDNILNYAKELIASGTSKPNKFALKKVKNENVRQMELAEIHFEELKAKNMNTLGQKFRLLKIYISNGLLEKACSLKDDIKQTMGPSLTLTPQYLCLFFRCSLFQDNLEETLHYYKTLRNNHPRFQLDIVRVLELAKFLVDHGVLDEIAIMFKNALPWIGNTKPLENKIVRFLNSVASKGNIELTKGFFDLLKTRNYTTITENTMGPLVETYLVKDDITGAVKEYERIAFEYRLRPNFDKLLLKTLEHKRSDLFKRVMLISRVERDNIRVCDVLYALAAAGSLDLLCKYVEVYRVDVTGRKFLKNLEERHHILPVEGYIKLIKVACEMKRPYSELIDLAINNLVAFRPLKEAKEFIEHIKVTNLEVPPEQMNILQNFIILNDPESDFDVENKSDSTNV
ncbi:UNVERIFIED_CONTAM: hypothetical protein PYX00_004434 [Menopon gallinae]|uniref:Leucine-rich PPR motif-containing protein, mitochondrial n=1 Tax=Menopon gallinae TaxID=328185 RepID=A0AAW2I3P4_9NEOP